jgi:hypothetical protein
VTASWLDDGSLSRYQASTPAATQAWDGFAAAAGAGCGTGAAPPASEVQALIAEMRRLRDAFLRP